MARSFEQEFSAPADQASAMKQPQGSQFEGTWLGCNGVISLGLVLLATAGAVLGTCIRGLSRG